MQETTNFLEKTVSIGDFVLDYRVGTLSNAAARHKLEPLTFEFLRLLIDHHREVVSRDTLLATLWQGRQVTDDAIRSVVRKLRICLGDDAREPKYIKTIPLRGYMLIAPIGEFPEAITPTENHFWSPLRWGLVVIFLGLFALIAYSFGVQQATLEKPIGVEYLTTLSGSEVSPDFSSTLNALAFSHRSNSIDPMQLYVKNLDTQRLQRLTWDDASYSNVHWSPDGHQLAYSRVDVAGVRNFLADFDMVKGFTANRPLNPDLLGTKYLLAWSASGRSIYFTDAYRAASPQGIYRFDLDSDQLHRLTAPSVAGIGDFFARESNDGKYLAILRGVSTNRIELLVLDIATGALLVNRLLPFSADHLVWDVDDNQLYLSGFSGDFFGYSLNQDKFTPILGVHAFINNVFFACSAHCYFMREHNGNFLDIQEQPNPFLAQSVLAADYINLPSADELPRYNADGSRIYFVSVTDDAVLIRRQGKQAPVKNLIRFDRTAEVSSIEVNAKETRLLVVLGKRISVIDLSTGETTFSTSELQDVRNPSWYPDGESIVFTRLEKRTPLIYRLVVKTGTTQQIAKGYLSYRFLSDGRRVAVDPTSNVYLIKTNSKPQYVTRMHSSDLHRWRVVGDEFYYTSQKGFTSFMTRVNLTTGDEVTKEIGRNRFRQDFDVHPNGSRVLVVKSLLAQSNLVRVRLTP